MSIKLNELVDSLIETAPPVELKHVSLSLSALTPSSIDDNIEKYAQEHAVIVGDTIVSKYNKDPQSSKYIDYVNKKLFNVDWAAGRVIDVEPYVAGVSYPAVYEDLVLKLTAYGEDYYPSTYAFTVIPGDNEDGLRVIIIGQRANHDNFYTGQWKSNYVISDLSASGEINLDIHYFEDGNVRLKFTEEISGAGIDASSALKIVNFINDQENLVIIKIVDQFNALNQQSFKNLRRLLPVTRSKINWGSAIGNYRLGSDVVNKK
ncbi:F-actin-capping protein subunit alpha [Candida viswanathii]|uniref:F-actin-capping protein subunit alpha n=1 Tax=Candida viswanathii TaxID=5486 RepID=A0A367YJX6_9ASCO|nr:F-actin-capping protein subunit alpha [Candida viswanathii]